MNLVFTGPSGSGKTSLIKALVASDRRLRFSISVTSRQPRPGEEDGREYYFRERRVIQEMIAAGLMLEWANVHGNLYGTPISEVTKAEEAGKDLVLDIDYQGAEQVREADIGAHFIYIMPPSRTVMERRLRGRGDTSEEDIAKRLVNASIEIQRAEDFDAWVENDRLEVTLTTLEGLLPLFRMRVRQPDERRFRNRTVLDRVLSTFVHQPT